MSPPPILKALSTIQKHGVRSLLMGGQACVLYGGAEISRDLDLILLSDDDTLARLSAALVELQADRIAVPPFAREHLDAGLAVHFRCRHPDAAAVRIDIMSKLRGVDAFEVLWERRTTVEVGELVIEVLALPDLVRAKKTQQDKDWPMIARLIEADYRERAADPGRQQAAFWLREARTPELLLELAMRFPDVHAELVSVRPLLAAVNDEVALRAQLRAEEEAEKQADREFWRPLRESLERLRHGQSRRD